MMLPWSQDVMCESRKKHEEACRNKEEEEEEEDTLRGLGERRDGDVSLGRNKGRTLEVIRTHEGIWRKSFH